LVLGIDCDYILIVMKPLTEISNLREERVKDKAKNGVADPP